VAQGRGQGRAVVNMGVNIPVPQKAVCKGLRNILRGGGGLLHGTGPSLKFTALSFLLGIIFGGV